MEYEDNGEPLLETMYLYNFSTYDFEIIEEQEEINIQDIEEIPDVNINNCTDTNYKYMANKYNELLRYLQQLDNKIKEIK